MAVHFGLCIDMNQSPSLHLQYEHEKRLQEELEVCSPRQASPPWRARAPGTTEREERAVMTEERRAMMTEERRAVMTEATA